MENLYQGLGKFTPDGLIAGTQVPVLVEGVTIASGQGLLRRGTVLGVVTSTGKSVAVNKAASDGSQNPRSILTDDIDATTEEVKTTAYISGEFNKNVLSFGGKTDKAADFELELRKLGIFLNNTL